MGWLDDTLDKIGGGATNLVQSVGDTFTHGLEQFNSPTAQNIARTAAIASLAYMGAGAMGYGGLAGGSAAGAGGTAGAAGGAGTAATAGEGGGGLNAITATGAATPADAYMTSTGAPMAASDVGTTGGIGGATTDTGGWSLSNIGNWMKTPNSTFGMSPGQGLVGLYDMWAKQKQAGQQMDRYQQMQDAINSYYAPGSPEEKLMRQEMERTDAAAGRQSQYGVRAVDLAAKIAQAKMTAMTNLANPMNTLLNQSLANQYGAPNTLAALYGQGTTSSAPSIMGTMQSATNTAKTISDVYNWITS